MQTRLHGARFGRVALIGLITLLPGTGFAQWHEFSVFGGYRLGGDFRDAPSDSEVELDAHSTYGVLLDLSRDALSAYEVFYSRQRTELQPAALFGSSSQFPVDVHYLHIGGETLYPRGDYVPFLVGGLGVTHMDPQPGGFDAETRLSLSLGGGLQKPLTENLGLRLETRAFVTLINSSESLFCADGRCRLSISGSGFWQFQMTAGLTWRY